MESVSAGQLVQVGADGRTQAGIVFDTPSALKVVVAVVDPRRGPVFRTVHPRTLSERAEEGADDPALLRLIRRTPAPVTREARVGSSSRTGRDGHSRPTAHRTTGK